MTKSETDMKKTEPEEFDDDCLNPKDLENLDCDAPPPFIIYEDCDDEVDYSPRFLANLDAEAFEVLLKDEKEMLKRLKKEKDND